MHPSVDFQIFLLDVMSGWYMNEWIPLGSWEHDVRRVWAIALYFGYPTMVLVFHALWDLRYVRLELTLLFHDDRLEDVSGK